MVGRRVVATLLVTGLGAGVAVGFGVTRAVHHDGTSPLSQAKAPTDCALSLASFLPADAMPGFTPMVNESLESKGAPAAHASSYKGGWIHGSIASKALAGPDRADEDAYARSLGYTVGKWPLVPLVGKVVADTPGILEVYEKHYAFSSAADATQMIQGFRASVSSDSQAHAIDTRVFGPTWAGGLRSVLGPNDGRHELIIQTIEQVGTHVVELAFQGGAGLTPESVVPLVQTATTRFAAACSAASSTAQGGSA